MVLIVHLVHYVGLQANYALPSKNLNIKIFKLVKDKLMIIRYMINNAIFL
jgi:hypothetical protein